MIATPTTTVRVSAIVSSYRAEAVMRGRLENLIGQTLYQRGELEIIVVDSGSPENEGAIVREFQERYPNLHYMRTERETVYGAWNRGILATRGHYVTNQNTDDRMRPDALERLADYLDAHPGVVLVHADQVQIPSGSEPGPEVYAGPGHWKWHPFSPLGLLFSTQVGSQPMWRRSLHDQVGYFDASFRILGDQEFFLRAAKYGDFRFLPEVLGTLDYRPTSVSQNVESSNQEWHRIFDTYTSREGIGRLLNGEPTLDLEPDRYQALVNNLVCHLNMESFAKPGLPFPMPTLHLLANHVATGRHHDVLFRNLLRIAARHFARDQIHAVFAQESPQRLDELLQHLEAEPDFEFLPDPLWQAAMPAQRHGQVSIIIPLFNALDFTQRCLGSLIEHTPGDWYEVILVDNGSSDGTPEFLQQLGGDVTVLRNEENRGFAHACNQGAAAAKGEYLLFLNNDTEAHPHWLEPLVQVLEQDPAVAAVGARLLYPDGTLQHAGVEIVEEQGLGIPLCPNHRYYRWPADTPEANRQADVQVLTAAALLVRANTFHEAGGFDESYWNGYEDVDLCFKLGEKGHRLVYEPRSCLTHFESVSGPERRVKEQANLTLLTERWLGRVKPDFLRTPDGLKRPHPDRGAVSLVIVTYNSSTTIESCVTSALRTLSEQDEVILVDNASQDHTASLLRAIAQRDARVKVHLSSENLGFSAGSNLGIRLAKGDYLVLLNPDTEVYPGWLDHMLSVAHEDVGAVGPTSDYVAGRQKWQLYAPAGLSADASPERIAAELGASNVNRGAETKLLIGFCMMLPRKVLDRIGLLDEELFLGNDDLDLSWRLRQAGYRLIVAAGAFVHHEGQVSFDTEPKETTKRLVQESTDALARKLVRHYGAGRVPSSMDLWGMNWFSPTPGILEGAEASMPSTPLLSDLKGFNILLAEPDLTAAMGAIGAFLEAFGAETDVALHVLAGAALPQIQAAILAAIAELGLSMERIPDVSLLDLPPALEDLPSYLPSADLVLGPADVAEKARQLGKAAIQEATPELLVSAARHFGALDWTAPALELDSNAHERWLVTGSWQPALEAYLAANPSGKSVALVIAAKPGAEQALQEEVVAWLDAHGLEPEGIPDVLIVSTPEAVVSLFRTATAWIQGHSDHDRTLALALGNRIILPNANAMRTALETLAAAHESPV